MDQGAQGQEEEEEKEDEEITTTINKETTKFDKWWIRQLLRGVETICVVTELSSDRERTTSGTRSRR